tara:strand:- start:5 stop:286 length:282 start_codon:yes stop_codon:yes gene_type:complete
MTVSISIEEIKNIFEDLGSDNTNEIDENTYILGNKSDFSSIEVVSFFSSLEEIYNSNGINIDLFEMLFNDNDEPPELTISELLKKISDFDNDK